jgi:hypothetical protein
MKIAKIKNMRESLDNSNGIQYYGGNDPAKMGGRFKKGGVAGGKKASRGLRVSKGLSSIDPNAPVSARTAARTTTDLGAPRVTSSAGLQR